MRLTEQQMAEIVARYQAWEGIRPLGRAFRVGDKMIKRVLAERGVIVRAPNATKFPPAGEAEIVRRYTAGESLQRLQRDYGCTAGTIRAIAARHGARVFTRGQRRRIWTDAELAEMAVLWRGGQSQHAIARHFGTHQTAVSKLLIDLGVQPAKRLRRGAAASKWKGGRIKDQSGYWMVLVPSDDPFASMRNSSGYVYEHRLIMAGLLGRPLHRHETVHHLDGDRANNDPANLQLRFGKHGTGIALCCADCGSRNIVPCDLG